MTSKRKNRAIVERWIITGTLELLTPTSLSNGDDDPVTDLPVVVDPLDGCALLTGASLAGALRSYVREVEAGYTQAAERHSMITALFGGLRGDEEGGQSPLIVEDALGDEKKPHIELRDGVSIDPTTRTAKDGEKYDRELLAAGTTFSIGFELLISEHDNLEVLLPALKLALTGLQNGKIRLGGRKRRGYGKCRVTNWQTWAFDLTDSDGLKHWLAFGQDGWDEAPEKPDWQGVRIADWGPLECIELPGDQRHYFQAKVNFIVDGSLLVRSGFEQDEAPDTAHIESRHAGSSKPVPVLPGTSMAGVMRAQALRIACTMTQDKEWAAIFINRLFGYMPDASQKDKHPCLVPKDKDEREARYSSRVRVDESQITGGRKLVQSRVKIDRFTGGAYESALFTEQPLFGGEFCLKLQVRDPKAEELGLLLLVLKDLWTGFVPIGGEASVGRGRLRGEEMVLTYKEKAADDPLEWKLKANGDPNRLTITGDAGTLNGWVEKFAKAAEGERT